MNLIRTIEEQAVFGFTGRINILLETGQLKGVIYLREGFVVQARLEGEYGEESLLKLFALTLRPQNSFRYVVEPEIVEENFCAFSLSAEQIGERYLPLLAKKSKEMNLRPPEELRLLIRGEFISVGELPTYEEFKVLIALAEFAKVEDIYRHAELPEYVVTAALVGLRKKGALKVFKTDQKR